MIALHEAIGQAAQIPAEQVTVELTKWVEPGTASLSPGMVGGRFTLLVSPDDFESVNGMGWKIKPLPQPLPEGHWFRSR